MTADSDKKTTASTPKNRRLGRGLASLMANTRQDVEQVTPAPLEGEPVRAAEGQYVPMAEGVAAPNAASSSGPVELAVEAIRPNPLQPRRSFDDAELAELAESIRVQGVLQPLLVVAEGEGYVLVAGERRLRASKLAGLRRVPCVIREATREQMLQWALIENIQRSDLNVIDRATAYRDYLDRFSATQQQLAESLSVPRSTIANHLRILDLCDDVQSLLAAGALSFGHGKVLAALAGRAKEQAELARRAAEGGLSVRSLEELVAGAVGGDDAPPPADRKPSPGKSEYVLDVERQLTGTIGTKVSIKPARKKNRGRVVIDYYSLDDFDRIVAALGGRIES